MTVATVIDTPTIRGYGKNSNSAIRRYSRYAPFDTSQALFPVFGVLLGAMAMTTAFIFERSALFISA